MSFPRYPQYKDSGVEWLGEVPAHWNVYKLQDVAKRERYSFVDGPFGSDLKNEEYTENGIPLIQLNNINEGAHVLNSIKYVSEEKADQLARHNAFPGDIAIAKMADPVARAAIVNDSFSRYVIVADCIRLSVEDTFAAPAFTVYAINSPYFRSHAIGLSSGITRLRINLGALKQIRLALPSLPEQTQIAAFLDRETTKIDELVAEQRRLMDLLKEKRQAVISHAVTRGLKPDAPMKPSGIEWLGDVPEHWDTRTIAKASTKITNGFVGPTRDILVEAGTPYIQATHIKNGRVNFDEGYFVRPDWSAAHSKSILCEGDVLIVQTGAGTGDVGLVSAHEVGYNCHALIIVAPDRKLLHGTYLSAVLQSTYGQEKLTSIETGAMHPHLNCGEVKFVEVPLPPLAEQSDIVSYLNKASSQFDTLTAEAQHAIDLLQERRTALISAAVTGQFDVREAI